MRYADIEAFVTAGYEALEYDQSDPSFPVIDPGPPTNTENLKLSSDRIVFLGLGGGPGLASEELTDRIFISAHVIGQQNDYADAENLAWQLDTMLLQVCSNSVIGNATALYITRTGGSPTLLEKDAAERFHFTCSYLVETGTGL